MLDQTLMRSRWAAFGAAVAVAIGGGTLGIAHATQSSGTRAVFVPTTPCRLFDTRAGSGVGPRSTPLGPGDTFTAQISGTNGNCTVPAGISAIAMNVTATNGTAASFLTIFPADVTRPDASSLNWRAGDAPTPNKVDAKVSADGKLSFFNSVGSVDVIADVVGYYDDHNHDDAYGPKAWGSIREDGTIRGASTNVSSVLHPGVGQYCVIFDPPVSGIHLEAAVVSGAGDGPVIGENLNTVGGADSCAAAPNGAGLQLKIYDANGTLIDRRFSFVVP